jgi:uncharacterized protein (TIGR00730 family)
MTSAETFHTDTIPHTIKSVGVYCGSSSGNHQDFTDAAVALGALLAKNGLTLVYGGGSVGLMGAIADSVLANGGRVHGIITEALRDAEVGHNGLSNLDVVATMHERKLLMAQLSDGFIALPGGFGTWDELCEVLTWTQLGIHRKPVVCVNVRNYWKGLLEQTQTAVECGFMKPSNAALLRSATDSAHALELLLAPIPLPEPKWSK